MAAGTFNIEIEKGSKYYQAMDIEYDDGTDVSLVGKVVRCVIKESYETDTILFDLTEANGGIVILNDAQARIALSINADDTDIEEDHGVYTIIIIDSSDTENEIERLLKGNVEFTEGTN